MILTSEDLLAISQLLDVKLEGLLESKLETKLQPMRDDIRLLKDDVRVLKDDVRLLKLQNENDILPRLRNIEACYVSTYERYKNGIAQLTSMQADIDIMKNAIMRHSDKLRRLK